MNESTRHQLNHVLTQRFDVPSRGRYEANATIFQKRKLEGFASEFHELPERFYELIDTLGRDQADYLIAYCERRALMAAAALEAEQKKLEVIQGRKERRHLLWAIPFALIVIWAVYSFNSSPEQVVQGQAPPPVVTVAPESSTPPPSQAFLVDVRYSQQAATSKYPQLGVAGSPLNRRFVSRYNEWKTRHDQRLGRSDWPQKLADDCVANP